MIHKVRTLSDYSALSLELRHKSHEFMMNAKICLFVCLFVRLELNQVTCTV